MFNKWVFERERGLIFAPIKNGSDKMDHICVATIEKNWCEESAENGIFIINAVNRQIPSKPIRCENVNSYSCPECGSDVKHNYCSNCGQSINWD